jgi:hypothetical protein
MQRAMLINEEVTAEVPQLDLPADLLAEVSRRPARRPADFRVDGWSPSLLERVKRLLGSG